MQSLKVTGYSNEQGTLAKLNALFQTNNPDWIAVDFSRWGDTAEYWNIIKSAILGKRMITFSYYNSNGEQATRRIEPYQLWFKQNSWFVKGYCQMRQSIRNFKLSRTKNLQMSEEKFAQRQFSIEYEPESAQGVDPIEVNLVLKIHGSQAYQVYDEFEEDQVLRNADDTFTVRVTCPENEWIYQYALLWLLCRSIGAGAYSKNYESQTGKGCQKLFII